MASSPFVDYYKMLGLSRDASPEELEAAYRILSQQYHPDNNPGDPDAARAFKRINKVYQVLSDPAQRALYDEWATQQPQAPAERPQKKQPSRDWAAVTVLVLLLVTIVATLLGIGKIIASVMVPLQSRAIPRPSYTLRPTVRPPVIRVTSKPTTKNSATPVTVTPLPTFAAPNSAKIPVGVPLAVGAWHACALTHAGGVKCWGDNSSGQLGIGNHMYVTAPVNVQGLSDSAVAIAAGVAHTCALLKNGNVQCWGDNHFGQLGDGSMNNSSFPVNVLGLSGYVVAIVAGNEYTCALTSAGAMQCWGDNLDQELGQITTIPSQLQSSAKPVTVIGLEHGVVAMAAGGYHACALTDVGDVICWGVYSLDRFISMGKVDVGERVVAIAANRDKTCALTTSGGVKCWGDKNAHGELGNGKFDPVSAPVDVVRFVVGLNAGVKAITGTCAVMDSGQVKCWGENSNGQLGDGTKNDSAIPVDVTVLKEPIKFILTGNSAQLAVYTCAVTDTDQVKCWGNNSTGQLGDATLPESLTPVEVPGLP